MRYGHTVVIVHNRFDIAIYTLQLFFLPEKWTTNDKKEP